MQQLLGLPHNSKNFPVSCFSAPWAKPKELWKLQVELLFVTFFLGHDQNFHSNNHVPVHSPSKWLPDYQLHTFHVIYLFFLSLPQVTHTQTYIHTCTQKRHQDNSHPLMKGLKYSKCFRGMMFGKKLLLR